MGFRNGAYITVWKEINNYGHNYVAWQCSTSKKNKQTGKYETTFSGIVRFIGQAMETLNGAQRGDRFKLGETDVTSYKSEDGKYGDTFAVFSCEKVESLRNDSEGGQDVSHAEHADKKTAPMSDKKVGSSTPDDDDDLPF